MRWRGTPKIKVAQNGLKHDEMFEIKNFVSSSNVQATILTSQVVPLLRDGATKNSNKKKKHTFYINITIKIFSLRLQTFLCYSKIPRVFLIWKKYELNFLCRRHLEEHWYAYFPCGITVLYTRQKNKWSDASCLVNQERTSIYFWSCVLHLN